MEEKLGPKYVAGTRIDLAKSYEESSPATAIFFILSPGVDPLKDLETVGELVSFIKNYQACLKIQACEYSTFQGKICIL